MHGDQQRTHSQPQVSQLEGKRRERGRGGGAGGTASATSQHICYNSCGQVFSYKQKEIFPIHSNADITSRRLWSRSVVPNLFGL